MFEAMLKLLPVIGPVVSRLPQFVDLFETIKDTLNEDDAATLESAYELAKSRSDAAHAELQNIVAEKTGN